MSAKPVVFVGLSGGVDSSVAALRLQRSGYSVVGVFIKVWHPEWLVCNWEQERLDAMRVAAHLNMPFMTCDAESAYKQGVADYFIAEYIAGRTPNPDVMCNQHVKFGAFLNFAREHGAAFIATGHYAQIEKDNNRAGLLRGVDTEKDQSYFLWTLTQEQLSQVMLPVGNSTKSVIREVAQSAGLPTAIKKDSQGVCFLGHIDIPEFLSHYTSLVPGAVLNKQGEQIGTHVGALVYTVGQRHGFTAHTHSTLSEPHYVVERDLVANTITVGTERPTLTAGKQLLLTECNWIDGMPLPGNHLQAQIRYRQTPFLVRITECTNTSATVVPDSAGDLPSAGQSCVLYDGMRCIGGGIIA